MLKRLRLEPQVLMLLEAGVIGLFFIQALRFLVAMVYGRVAGASAALSLQALGVLPLTNTAPDPAVVSSEVTFLVYMLALPLLAVVLGRLRPLIVVAALLAAVGRLLMVGGSGLTPTSAAALVVGGGLMYLAMLVRERAQCLPYFFVLGIAGDQLFRAVGNTLDPSWSPAYENVQLGLSIGVVLLALLTYLWDERRERPDLPAQRYGLLPIWSGIGLGGLLFVELALLALPNAIAARADSDYTTFVPFVTLATLLPIVPFVRARARSFLGLFEGSVRGWLWMLLVVLLVVFGTRFRGALAGTALVMAQFGVSTMWWWLARPRGERERSFGGLWLILGIVVFGLLVLADNFTYDYAYVRNLTGNLAFLNDIVTPLLRGFRGLGLGVLLLSVFLGALPMTQTQRRIPWMSGSAALSLLGVFVVAAATVGAAYAARPPVVTGVRGVDSIRIGTYNIHSGFDEFYNYDLEGIVRTIQQSGANVVLLQEVEAGRITSFGVDQTLWLARRLGMDRRFFPTNEGLYGLAVLSNVPIAFDDGELLTSQGQQTGLQRVQIQPDSGVVITLYNTWLEYLLELDSEASLEQQQQAQQTQLNEIFTIIARHHPGGVLGRTVLGGTFNNVPDSPLLQQVRAAGFENPHAGLPPEIGATLVRSGVQRTVFDYLWLRNLPLGEGAGVLPTSASDHRMAVVGVLIERTQ
jgi:endonuclease/exonuclease/phosphatase family metal-dependent hydrolase